MKLYILRHAIAEERDQAKYPDDSLRPLTVKGEQKMRKIAASLEGLSVTVDLVLTSPYTRALETAKIVTKTLGLKANQLVQTKSLAPDALPNDLIAEINEKYKVDNLMLVGHEPDLGNLIALLVAGTPSLGISLKKGGLACLTIDTLIYGRCATLEWLLTPAQLVKPGR